MTSSNGSQSISQLLQSLEQQLDKHINDTRNHKYGGVTVAEIIAVKTALELVVLPKLHILESAMQPISRLPADVFILIPSFFTRDKFLPMLKPLVAMTHVCRSWRKVLLSVPSLWTQIDFSITTEFQQEIFLHRSENQPLYIHHDLKHKDQYEALLPIICRNAFRLQGLEITSYLDDLKELLKALAAAPELKQLLIKNMGVTHMKLPKIFGGQMLKLTNFELYFMETNLREFNFPSLTRFIFESGASVSVQDLTSFLGRCPLLKFIQISLLYDPQPSTAPPQRRVLLADLYELRLNQTACTTGLLDHLILPNCKEMALKGLFVGATGDGDTFRAVRIHPSSIDHLSTMRGITKAVAMPNSCILSGPNGNLRLWCSEGTRGNLDAAYFTSLSPISVLQIRELWIGPKFENAFGQTNKLWKQTTAGVRGAFEVLTNVEDLTIVRCQTKPVFTKLGATVDGGKFLLPGLKRLTIYGDFDVPALIQCAKARKGHAQPLMEVAVVWDKDPGINVMQEIESLRDFVGLRFSQCVGDAPILSWKSKFPISIQNGTDFEISH